MQALSYNNNGSEYTTARKNRNDVVGFCPRTTVYSAIKKSKKKRNDAGGAYFYLYCSGLRVIPMLDVLMSALSNTHVS
jgi:hypothetical protein